MHICDHSDSLNIACAASDKHSKGTLIFYSFYWINHYDLLFLNNSLKATTLGTLTSTNTHMNLGRQHISIALFWQLSHNLCCVTITRRQLLCQFIQMVMTKHIKPKKPSLQITKDKKYFPRAKRLIFCKWKRMLKCAVLQ